MNIRFVTLWVDTYACLRRESVVMGAVHLTIAYDLMIADAAHVLRLLQLHFRHLEDAYFWSFGLAVIVNVDKCKSFNVSY